MRGLLNIILVLLPCLSVLGQDILYYNDGQELEVKMIEILPQTVKYKRFHNLDGPLITVDRAQLFMVRFENGTKEKLVPNTYSEPQIDHDQKEKFKETKLQRQGYNLETGLDKNGRTPLHRAILSKLPVFVIDSLLLQKSNPNVRDNQNETPMQLALIHGSDSDVIESLVRYGGKRRDGVSRGRDPKTKIQWKNARKKNSFLEHRISVDVGFGGLILPIPTKKVGLYHVWNPVDQASVYDGNSQLDLIYRGEIGVIETYLIPPINVSYGFRYNLVTLLASVGFSRNKNVIGIYGEHDLSEALRPVFGRDIALDSVTFWNVNYSFSAEFNFLRQPGLFDPYIGVYLGGQHGSPSKVTREGDDAWLFGDVLHYQFKNSILSWGPYLGFRVALDNQRLFALSSDVGFIPGIWRIGLSINLVSQERRRSNAKLNGRYLKISTRF